MLHESEHTNPFLTLWFDPNKKVVYPVKRVTTFQLEKTTHPRTIIKYLVRHFSQLY
jgi:hypothetical protein